MNLAEIIKTVFKKGEPPLTGYEELESGQRDMIRGVVEFGETTVKEIMVPRIDAEFVQLEAPRDEVLKIVAESEHSRFPVYKETIDNIAGVVYVKDILKKLIRGEDFKIEDILHKAFFVPETKHIDDLLHEFQGKHVHLAIVVDEYGGVSGIVSLEDIIEEIIGDIQDEFDHEKEEVVKLSDNSWLCGARVNLTDLAEQLCVELPIDDFDTLGGFVFDLLGRIPVKYEKVSYNNIDFIVQDIDGRKIVSIKVVITGENEDYDSKNSA
ncbi:MAG: hemolysin family protein [Spirochaetaceae bacterium]|jgi:CBS domain containing-hemolysin-like protein|nr:hemolysin family protein [Spirochaetaceae bacterium]